MKPSACLAIVAFIAVGCSGSGSAPAPHAAPATVDHARTEAELTTVKLTPEAAGRLGIETVTVQSTAAAATRTLGGEVVVPEGRGVVVTAPLAGTLTGGPAPQPGASVRRGDRLMTIAPLVSADRDQQIDAQRAVTVAEAEELAARQRLQRLEQLLRDGAASARSVEEARAQRQVTAAALTAARERLAGAAKSPVGAQGELVISAPFDGVIQRIAAAPGQVVASAAPLLEIAQLETLWVRVPIYAGDAAGVDDRARASVTRLGAKEAPLPAMRVAAPRKGDPAAASVDLYYAVSGAAGVLRPGERVLVEVPLTSSEQGLVLPDAAVLYDIHGDAWVYQALGENAFARRRIEISRHAGDRVVVRRGIAAGASVVTAGAAELFGTEFGAGH